MCKECLKSRKHISHGKNIIFEILPSEKELNIVENIISYYEEKIENLEKEKLCKTKELNNKLKESKKILKQKKELKIKDNINNMEKELKKKREKYLSDLTDIRNKYENEIKLIKYNL